MKNKYKTKKQLVEELEALQKQAEKLKKTETRAKQAGKPSSAVKVGHRVRSLILTLRRYMT